jgi:hypothetical protein
MTLRYIALLALVVTTLGCAHGGLPGSERPAAGDPRFLDPHAVVATYLKAVDRGELTVFARKLDRSMVEPRRVEYAFELESRVPTLRVYAELRRPMAVPNQDDCEVRGVSASLDADGRIVETEAHVWQKQRTRVQC